MSDIVTAQGIIIAINDDYDDSLSIIISDIIVSHIHPYPKPVGVLMSDTKSLDGEGNLM